MNIYSGHLFLSELEESNGTLRVSIMIVVGCWDGRVGGGRYNRYPSEEGRGRSTFNFLSGRG